MRDAYKPTLADDVLSDLRDTGYNEGFVQEGVGISHRYNIQQVFQVLPETYDLNLNQLENLPHPVMWLEWYVSKSDVKIGALCLSQERIQRVILVFGREGTTPVVIGDVLREEEENAATFNSFLDVPESRRNGIVQEMANAAGMAMYAIKLLNCKNITTFTREGPATINERRKREGKPPYTSYKVLKLPIGDQARVVNGNQNEDKNEGLTRLHICRGHFKTYTEEKPLMGRHTGTYWWPQMLKGKKENGQVIKDYELTVAS